MLDRLLKMIDVTEAELKEWIRPVQDPDLGISLVDLGLVYGAQLDAEGKATVQLTLTSPGCPAADHMISEICKKLKEHPKVTEAKVDIVWEPKWDPKIMASEEAKEHLGIW